MVSVFAAALLSVPPSTPLGASAHFGVQAPTDLFGVQAPTPLKHYTSPKECGFEFDYPSDWVVTPGRRCNVQLRPGDFAERMKERDVDLYTLDVTLEFGGFAAAADKNGFDFVRGKWVVLGRHGIKSDAEVVVTTQWYGLRGDATVGCFSESQGYAGFCDQPVVVLRDDNDNMWSMRGGPQSQDAFDGILTTLRFVDR